MTRRPTARLPFTASSSADPPTASASRRPDPPDRRRLAALDAVQPATRERPDDGDGPTAADPPTRPLRPAGLSRLVRGRPEDPAWVRPALRRPAGRHRVPLPLGTRHAPDGPTASTPPPSRPAPRAGRRSSSARPTASNFITVDKPPASLWVMEISARMFGVNSWSILVPQALEGVATVGLLYRDRAPLVRTRARPCWPARWWP